MESNRTLDVLDALVGEAEVVVGFHLPVLVPSQAGDLQTLLVEIYPRLRVSLIPEVQSEGVVAVEDNRCVSDSTRSFGLVRYERR